MDGSDPNRFLAPPVAPPPAGSLSALVVDGSLAQRSLIATILGRMGLQVTTVSTPDEALALCAGPTGAAIGMVISGWQLQGMNGPEFCRAFRAMDRDLYTYFILITAQAERKAKAAGLEAGADDFVTRPVDMAELRARVRAGQRMLAMQEDLLHRNHEVATTLHDLQEIHDVMNRDLVEARKLQRGFLPADHGQFGPHSLRMRLITQGQIGGDLVGHFDLGDGRLALYSIDVSGHGIASALLTGRLAGLFGSWTPGHNVVWPQSGAAPDPPDVVLGRVNDFMLQSMETDIYFTCVLAYLHLETGRLEMCQAGHPHPMVRDKAGIVRRIGGGGPPVGLLPGAPFECFVTKIDPGDSLLLYSDGLTECADSWGDMLEEEGLMDLFSTVGARPIEVIDGIEAALQELAGIAGFEDDVSMLVLEFGDEAPVSEDALGV